MLLQKKDRVDKRLVQTLKKNFELVDSIPLYSFPPILTSTEKSYN